MMRLTITALALALPTAAHAGEGWDKIKPLELAWQGLNVADFVTTQICLDHGTCHENNPLLGKHPSTEKMVAVKLGGAVLHYTLARWAADRDPHLARIFEIVTITLQGGVVASNLRFVF